MTATLLPCAQITPTGGYGAQFLPCTAGSEGVRCPPRGGRKEALGYDR